MLDVDINHVDGGSCSAPLPERRRLSTPLFWGGGQLEDDLVATPGGAAEDLRAKSPGEAPNVL